MGFVAYPSKGIMQGERGLNLVDYLLRLGPDSMLHSANVYFDLRTVRRRRGFTRHSTEDWSAYSWRGGMAFQDNYGNERLLVARNNGDVREIQAAGASTALFSGLGTGREVSLAAGFGSGFLANGDDTLRRFDATSDPLVACTGRVAGVPDKPTLSVSAGTSPGQTGSYAVVATAAIESAGTRLLESDWSTIQEITLADQSLSGTVTPPSPLDSRITHFYIYRTDAGGAQPKYLTKVAAAGAAPVPFSNVAAADTALGTYATARGKNIPPPDAPEQVLICGSRAVLIKGAALHLSPRGLNAYDVETFPFQLNAPGPGPIKGAIAVPNPGSTPGTNSLFFAQESNCSVLFNADPTQPITNLSPDTGLMNARALVSRGRGIFFVDRRRGVMWWPGEGIILYAVGASILSVITGRGYQGVQGNLGDGNVSLAIWRDMLLLTVRDSSAVTGGNKVYLMDLLAFERNMGNKGPEAAAVWAGPWENTGLGFYKFIPRLDGSLILLDNQNRTILEWDPETFSDEIGGEDVDALPLIRLGTALGETLEENKRIHQVYLIAYANQVSTLRIRGEETRFDLPGITLNPASYGDIPFEDIVPIDIPVSGQAWKSEGPIDWSAVAVWFILEVTTADASNDWIWVGMRLLYTRTKVTKTYV